MYGTTKQGLLSLLLQQTLYGIFYLINPARFNNASGLGSFPLKRL